MEFRRTAEAAAESVPLARPDSVTLVVTVAASGGGGKGGSGGGAA